LICTITLNSAWRDWNCWGCWLLSSNSILNLQDQMSQHAFLTISGYAQPPSWNNIYIISSRVNQAIYKNQTPCLIAAFLESACGVCELRIHWSTLSTNLTVSIAHSINQIHGGTRLYWSIYVWCRPLYMQQCYIFSGRGLWWMPKSFLYPIRWMEVIVYFGWGWVNRRVSLWCNFFAVTTADFWSSNS